MFCKCEQDNNGRVVSLCGAHYMWLREHGVLKQDKEIAQLREALKLALLLNTDHLSETTKEGYVEIMTKDLLLKAGG